MLGITLHFNHSVNSPWGLFISNPFEGDSFERGALFKVAKRMVLVLSSSPKITRIRSGKAQVQEVGGHVAKDQKQIRTSKLVN